MSVQPLHFLFRIVVDASIARVDHDAGSFLLTRYRETVQSGLPRILSVPFGMLCLVSRDERVLSFRSPRIVVVRVRGIHRVSPLSVGCRQRIIRSSRATRSPVCNTLGPEPWLVPKFALLPLDAFLRRRG